MKRVVEPELMIDPLQVQSYYKNDRDQIKHLFKLAYMSVKKQVPETMVDLGCGPGDLTEEMAMIHPSTKIVGIDNSAEMLSLTSNHDNITFEQRSITDITQRYDRVISSLTLHHFHDPLEFWKSIKRISPTDVFILDFIRPDTEEELQEIVKFKEPYLDDIFRLDFENSLRACFTVEEIKSQLDACGLTFSVHKVDQYHLKANVVIIAGIL